jgi:hypothetical protein
MKKTFMIVVAGTLAVALEAGAGWQVQGGRGGLRGSVNAGCDRVVSGGGKCAHGVILTRSCVSCGRGYPSKVHSGCRSVPAVHTCRMPCCALTDRQGVVRGVAFIPDDRGRGPRAVPVMIFPGQGCGTDPQRGYGREPTPWYRR